MSASGVTAVDRSTLSLVDELVKPFVRRTRGGRSGRGRDDHRDHRPKSDRRVVQRLVAVAYDVLLFPRKHADRPSAEAEGLQHGLSESDCLLAAVYGLRRDGKLAEAERLERCVAFLYARDVDATAGDATRLRPILRLLLLLSSTDAADVNDVSDGHKVDDRFRIACERRLTDTGSSPSWLVDADAWHAYEPNGFRYSGYPRDIFERPMKTLESNENALYFVVPKEAFDALPGTRRHATTSFLSDHLEPKRKVGGRIADPFSKLFGALVRRFVDPVDLDVELEIPELGSTSPSSVYESRSGRSSKSQSSEDEGFQEAELFNNSADDDVFDVWTAAQSAPPKTHFIWEAVGRRVVAKEKPYLTEAGPRAVDRSIALMQYNFALVDPTSGFAFRRRLDVDDLFRDARYALLGVPSQVFPFSEAEAGFYVAKGLSVAGWSPESLEKLLSEFATDGTHYWRLCRFSTSNEMGTVYDKGYVFQAFCCCLKQILRYYQAGILTSSCDTLLQLLFATRKFRGQLRQLADLCSCSGLSFVDDSEILKGTVLVSRLFSRASEAIDSDFFPVLVSLLSAASVPYLKFLYSWVYEGVCDDRFGEFFVRPSDEYLYSRDQWFWKKGFSLVGNLATETPLFLEDVVPLVFLCGKSLHLLKLCNSQHHLCIAHEAAPRLKLTFCENELRDIERQTRRRTMQMEVLAKQRKQTCRMLRRANIEKKQTFGKSVGAVTYRDDLPSLHRIPSFRSQGQIESVRSRHKSEREERERPASTGYESKRTISTESVPSLSDYGERPESRNQRRENRLLRFHSVRSDTTTEATRSSEDLLSKSWSCKSDDKMQISPDPSTFELKMHVTPDTTPSSETAGTMSLLSEDLMSISMTTSDEPFTPSDAMDLQIEIKEILNNAANLMMANAKNDTATSDANANTIDNAVATSISNELKSLNENLAYLHDRTEFPRSNDNEEASTGARKKWNHDAPENRINAEQTLHVKSRTSRCKKEKTLVDVDADDASVICNEMTYNESAEGLKDRVFDDLSLFGATIGTKSNDPVRASTLKGVVERPVAARKSEFLLTEHETCAALKTRGRSVHGHASDSTIQFVLYGDTKDAAAEKKSTLSLPENKPLGLATPAKQLTPTFEPYSEKFEFNSVDAYLPVSKDKMKEESDLDLSLPLSVVVQRSLLVPLRAQIKLVNESLVDYFLVDLDLIHHFEVLHDFVLLNDGEFAQTLAAQLFEKVAQGVTPIKLLNPKNLDAVLNTSLNASLRHDDPFVNNLSFLLRSTPSYFPSDAPAPFPGLELQYRVAWPLNLVITPACLTTYNKIFHFFMKIRHVHWALTDVFYHLKQSVKNKQTVVSPQFTQMQLFRHEMHHFVRVLQAYVSNQVLQVSWLDLLRDVANVDNLDELIDVHSKYLKNSLVRCLLNPKALPIRRMLYKVLSIILKFHAEMMSSAWKTNPRSGHSEHPAYWRLHASHKNFKEQVTCLYSVWLRDAARRSSHQHVRESRLPTMLARLLDEMEF